MALAAAVVSGGSVSFVNSESNAFAPSSLTPTRTFGVTASGDGSSKQKILAWFVCSKGPTQAMSVSAVDVRDGSNVTIIAPQDWRPASDTVRSYFFFAILINSGTGASDVAVCGLFSAYSGGHDGVSVLGSSRSQLSARVWLQATGCSNASCSDGAASSLVRRSGRAHQCSRPRVELDTVAQRGRIQPETNVSKRTWC